MKRLFALILAFLLCFTMALTASAEEAPPFSYARTASMSDYRDLFYGITDGRDARFTRAAAAAIFARHSGDELPETSSPFTDVSSSAWYAPYVIWAVENDLILPAGDAFRPDDLMTREELSLLLYHYLDRLGMGLYPVNDYTLFWDGREFTNQDYLDAATAMHMGGVLLKKDLEGPFCPHDTLTVTEAEGAILRFFGGLSRRFPTLPVATAAESEAVDDSWFDDVCFIGHSQVVGMQKYFHLDNADYYAVVGHTAQNVLDFEYYPLRTGRDAPLSTALETYDYNKVYIMLGVNDFSLDDDRIEQFMKPMREILDLVKTTQPEATVYLLSIAPIGLWNPMPILYSYENAVLYSQAIKNLALEYGAEYLDVFRLMADRNGHMLPAFDAGDGIHINAEKYENIKDYLKTHTVAE